MEKTIEWKSEFSLVTLIALPGLLHGYWKQEDGIRSLSRRLTDLAYWGHSVSGRERITVEKNLCSRQNSLGQEAEPENMR